MSESVYSSVEPPVGWLVFDNANRRNAMTYEMWEAVPKRCRELDEDPRVRVVAFVGAGTKAFVAGADISQFAERRSGDSGADYERVTSEAYAALESLTKPTIAMIRGFCIGGGLAIALAADVRYCSSDSVFALPPARLGIGYSAEGLERLVDLVGPAVTKEMVYTADLIPADQALAWGLVNRMVEPGELAELVDTQASTMAQRAPLSQVAAKLAVDDYLSGHPNRASVAAAISDCFNSEDYAEGIEAFLAKRAPRFRGR